MTETIHSAAIHHYWFERDQRKSAPPLCGIVLAGGEGKRLRSFVHLLRRDLLPKQYVSFIGSRSMLTHTLRRAEMFIPAARLYTVVNQDHLSFPEVRQQLSARVAGTVIVQPSNKGSGAGLLLALIYLHKRYGNCTVAVFPADQFAMEETQLMKYVRLADAIVRKQPANLVLLGITPDSEETEYGYIVPRDRFKPDGWGSYDVSRLLEKPDAKEVADLMRCGALWNTMMMVFNSATLLAWVDDLMPAVAQRFRAVYAAIGAANEAEIVRQVYAQLAPINCSIDLLEPIIRHNPKSVLALPIEDVLWSDWGSESRVLDSLRQIGNSARLNGLPRPPREPVERADEEIAAAQSRLVANQPRLPARINRKELRKRGTVRPNARRSLF